MTSNSVKNAAPLTAPTGVKRTNRIPKIVAGGVLAMVTGAIFYNTQTAQPQNKPEDANALTPQKQMLSDARDHAPASEDLVAAGLGNDFSPTGIIKKHTAQKLSEAQDNTLTTEPVKIPSPAPPVSFAPPPEDSVIPPPPEIVTASSQEMNQLKSSRMQRFAEALNAPTEIGGTDAPKAEASSLNALPALSTSTQSIPESLSELKARVDREAADANGGAQAEDEEPNSDQSRKPLAATDDWRNPNTLEKIESRYEIRSGWSIPASLSVGINSELPGPITAQVTQNVYDSATGKYLLIPQGTKVIGEYSNQVAFGQSRVLVAWNRLVFPNGSAFNLGSVPSQDMSGYAGFKDQVDNHFLRTFGSALLMSGIIAGVNYSQNQTGSNTNGYNMNSSNVLSESLGQGLGQSMQQLFQRNLNVSPVLKIRPGYVMNVVVKQDLVFPSIYKATN